MPISRKSPQLPAPSFMYGTMESPNGILQSRYSILDSPFIIHVLITMAYAENENIAWAESILSEKTSERQDVIHIHSLVCI